MLDDIVRPYLLKCRWATKVGSRNLEGSADVRFTPESGHVQCKVRCLLRAKSGHTLISGPRGVALHLQLKTQFHFFLVSLVRHRVFEIAFEGCRRTFRPSQLRSVKPRNEKPVRVLTNQEGRVPRATGQPLWELSSLND